MSDKGNLIQETKTRLQELTKFEDPVVVVIGGRTFIVDRSLIDESKMSTISYVDLYAVDLVQSPLPDKVYTVIVHRGKAMARLDMIQYIEDLPEHALLLYKNAVTDEELQKQLREDAIAARKLAELELQTAHTLLQNLGKQSPPFGGEGPLAR